ncbi:MAG: TlpA family protein disulfide reductase [Eubacteriales bacterium]
MENKYGGDIKFIVADITTPEGGALAERFNIYYIPVYFILDGKGNIVNRIEYSQIENRPRETLDSLISQAIKG